MPMIRPGNGAEVFCDAAVFAPPDAKYVPVLSTKPKPLEGSWAKLTLLNVVPSGTI
jgi:hypothetical protein